MVESGLMRADRAGGLVNACESTAGFAIIFGICDGGNSIDGLFKFIMPCGTGRGLLLAGCWYCCWLAFRGSGWFDPVEF